jgi:hypothetical protein
MSEEARRRADAASTGSPNPSALSSAERAGIDPRVVAAWREWLGVLATDAEAALAAAMAYKALDGGARDRWLGVLEQDAEVLTVPRIAVYAPLLAVESDPARRARIMAAIGPFDEHVRDEREMRALFGTSGDGLRVATITSPLYLDFVQVLACGYHVDQGFHWVRHDPIVQREVAPRAGDELSGAVLESTPIRSLIDELALVVLAHGRSGRELPEALKTFADLFEPVISLVPSP